jgi:hypothetical protein
MMEKEFIDGAVLYVKTVTALDEKMLMDYLKASAYGMKYIFSSDTSSEIVTMTITPELLK